MVPFLFFKLKALLEIVVKSSIIKSCQLKEIDLCDESTLLPLDKMNLGFAVDQVFNKEKKSDTVNLSMIKEFKKDCQSTQLFYAAWKFGGNDYVGTASFLSLIKVGNHGSSPPNFRGDLKISDQNNWGRDLSKKLNFLGGAMNPNDAMVVVLKDILLCLLGFRFIYIVYIS